MIETLLRNATLFLYELVLTAMVILLALGRTLLSNAKISLPIIALILIFLALLLIMNYYSWFFIYLWFYLELLVNTLLNSSRLLLLGINPALDVLKPILGEANDVFLSVVLSLADTFCPEKDWAGECLGLDRLLILQFDIMNTIVYFLEYIVIQVQIYAAMVSMFVCESLIASGAYDEFPTYCLTTDGEFLTTENLIANGTFVYISEKMAGDIESVVGVLGSVAKWIVRDGVDLLVRTLIFLTSASMIILKYFTVGWFVVVNMIAWILLGIVYNSNPKMIREGMNSTLTPTFERTYDEFSSVFSEELLNWDPIELYNVSQYACPATVCEVYLGILEDLEYTSYTVYTHVNTIFIWMDDLICSIIFFSKCGEHFGLCGYAFSEEGGMVFLALKAMIEAIVSGVNQLCIPGWKIPIINVWVGEFCLPGDILYYPCNFKDPGKRSTCYANFWSMTPRWICEQWFTGQVCPCAACSIDPDKQYSLLAIIGGGISKHHKVPCNPDLPAESSCCLSSDEDFYYFDQNCFNSSGGGYTSIFYYLKQLQFYGNAEKFLGGEVFRCAEPLGYGYDLQHSELRPNHYRYFRRNYMETVKSAMYYYRDLWPTIFKTIVMNSAQLNWAAIQTSTMDAEYLYTVWSWRTEKVEPNSDMYQYYKSMLYSYTIGCYGPDYLNYYHDTVATMLGYVKSYGFPDWDTTRKPYDDDGFTTSLASLGYTSVDIKTPDYVIPIRTVYLSIPIPTVYLSICPIYLRAKALYSQPESTYHELGNHYYFHLAVSLIEQLRELYLARNVAGALQSIGIATLPREAVETIDWPPRMNQLTPSVFLDLLRLGKVELLQDVQGISEIIANASLVLSYDDRENFWEEMASGDVCLFYSVDPGSPREFRGYGNALYPDQKRHSFFNYHVAPVHGTPEFLVEQFPHSSIVRLDLCELLIDETQTNATWEDYEGMFFSGDLDGATHEFMSNSLDLEPVADYWDLDLKSDAMGNLSKNYLVARTMREKYFASLFLLEAIDGYLTLDPCNSSLNEVSYYDLSGTPYTTTDCKNELDHLEPFLRYFSKHWGEYWYSQWVDQEEWPENVCMRLVSVDETLAKIDEYYAASPPSAFPFNWRYGDITSAQYLISATLLYRFMEFFSSKTSEEWLQEIGYDRGEAVRFCANVNESPPRYGLGLPATECLLYMTAMDFHTEFRNTLLGNSTSDCDVMENFLRNVYSYGMTDPQITIEMENFQKYVECETSALRNVVPQDQAEASC